MNSLYLVLALVAADPATAPATKTQALPGHNFTLPQGFDIELVAGPPLVDRPIHADFDERGRLYVCESSGTNDPAVKQLADKPHWILRLEDTDGDGRFDKRTKYADKMMFPEGMMWLNGSIYVGAPPSIWKFTDTDDDGVADQREEWMLGKTLTGCANDLHGPYAGPDGWIYWCKGAWAEQTHQRTDLPPLVSKAAHIFRCRPDGSGIETVMTGGMDNPVEVAFTPGGERIFTTTFFQEPGGGKRDGLIHAIYGGVYGKPNAAVVQGHPRTGDLMPVLTHMGAAAPAGLARFESAAFGAEYRDNLFAALFNMHKVTRHVLTPEGSTFASRDEDFVVSDNFDFHPTDVLEDADGSLIVVDTGGWYKLCCPTSQLVKPDVLGGLYRVRRSGVSRTADPRALSLKWESLTADELTKLLSDDRPAVRRRAANQLGRLGAKAVAALAEVIGRSRSAEARANALWALSPIEGAAAGAAIRPALDDTDETVRQVALHVTSVRRDRDALPKLIEIVGRSKNPANRRAAAEALGRLGNVSAVPVLLTVAGEELDRPLEHSVTFALIEIGSAAETSRGLASTNPRTRRAALLTLDQIEGGNLDSKTVAELLTSSDSLSRETAAWIFGRHPNWAPALLPYLEKRLADAGSNEADAAFLLQLLSRFAGDDAIQKLMASRLADPATGLAKQRLLLQAMQRSGLRTIPATWMPPLIAILKSSGELAPAAIAVVRAIPRYAEKSDELGSALFVAAENETLTPSVRLEALGSVPGGLSKLRPVVFDFVRGSLSPDAQVSVRLAAADAISKASLDDGQLAQLVPAVRSAGPLELERVVAPFARGSNPEVGRSLVASLADSKALVSLKSETLQSLFKGYEPAVREEAEKLNKLQSAATELQKAKIESLLAASEKGDIRRGQLVFNSQKAACSTCHAIGYLGGTIGPDLSKPDRIRNERDLLESIVFPSASFVRNYEPVVITTKAGKVFSGTIRQDGADEVVLNLNAKETARIPRSEIEEMVSGTVSIMPAGLDQQLTPQELIDLITFLKSGR